MLQFRILFAAVLLCILSCGTPIKNGESVGKVNLKLQVTNKGLYPYAVHIKVSVTKNRQRRTNFCAGVIVGRRTILTAGHCLYGKINPTLIAHAGVLDVKHEEYMGQTITMKEYMVHPEYTEECRVDRSTRCCYDINDIAIVWLEEQFEFGTYVQRAKLNRHVVKPVNQKGWILGWGLDNTNNLATMLQRGEVQVISRAECDQYNPRVHITNKVLCVKPGSAGATSAEGDSGGPFEIDGVVYGISSHSIYKEPCWTEEINVYTDVAQYIVWLDRNLRAGPPSERPSSSRPSSPQRERKI